MDISVQRIKLNEELKSLQESINKGKEFKKKMQIIKIIKR